MEPFRTLCTCLIAVLPEISLNIATTIADKKAGPVATLRTMDDYVLAVFQDADHQPCHIQHSLKIITR